jgi:hypothetical protein
VQEPLLRQHDGLLLFENLEKSCQGNLDAEGIDGFALGDDVNKDYFLRVKEDEDICFVLEACTFAFRGPGWPFFTQCSDCRFISGVWKDTADSSMGTILFRTTKGAE